ncbi:hypothetical protein D934_00595 [Xylella fastidiosa subsp. sandyi Ann-1]|uniref:Uncharacterized protein n=1 Tax=Xylella fastidiosa subsp. sandyi Ann-1 TaxID=155920 RepID=A0A060HC51_XYLFS|nr:hypothetical protein D934_00595 [Xylella fastidiosa subsp. sandyi Ann-1]
MLQRHGILKLHSGGTHQGFKAQDQRHPRLGQILVNVSIKCRDALALLRVYQGQRGERSQIPLEGLRLNRQAGSTKKYDGCFDQFGIHCCRPWRQGRGGDNAWITVERTNQKAHVFTKRQTDVVLHYPLFKPAQNIAQRR